MFKKRQHNSTFLIRYVITQAKILVQKMSRKNKRESWEEEEEIIWVSRAEMKRDMDILQKLGEELVNIKPSILKKFPLDDMLLTAVIDAQRFVKEAKRRQLQLIGKMMRTRDPEPIQAALDLLNNKYNQQAVELNKLEKIRDRLITEGDIALNDLMEIHPDADRQKLRQLARTAKKELEGNKPPKASREIFQILRKLKSKE